MTLEIFRDNLHAGVAAQAWERSKLEKLCRYITRPAISEKRVSITSAGNIRYQLKTPYNNGTTHVILEPLDFIGKLAALVPKPRVNPGSSPGQALGAAPEARVQHRCIDLPKMWWRGEGYSLYRRSGGD